MTREESIKYLKEMKDECNDTIHKIRYVTQEEALEMAIKALEQEPSGDLISRQAVFDALYELCNTGETLIENPWRDNPHIDALIDAIEDLPSVKQEPKTEVLDKIRAEIEQESKDESEHPYGQGLRRALEIIDKYRKEQE